MAVKYIHKPTGETFYGVEALLDHIGDNLLDGLGSSDEASTEIENTIAFLGQLDPETDDSEEEEEEGEEEEEEEDAA